MAKRVDSITLGLGDLSINGQDVGFLGGRVVFTTDIELTDFKIGVPKTTVKRVVTGFETTLKASLAQIDVDTLHLALGIGTVTNYSDKTRLAFGTAWELQTLTNVQFVHTRADGKTIKICFPKAQVKPGTSELSFSSEDYILQDVVITAIKDTDPGSSANPLGFIEVQS